MSRILYKMPARVQVPLDRAIAALREFSEEQDEARTNASDRWLEGDRSADHEAWLDELVSYADHLLDCPRAAKD